MITEKNYDFLYRAREIHQRGRRDPEVTPAPGDAVLDESWRIIVPRGAGRKTLRAALDLQDYLETSMDVSLRIERRDQTKKEEHTILFIGKDAYQGTPCAVPEKNGSYTLEISEESVLICGSDENSMLYASVRLEDLMNLREAPFLTPCSCLRENLTRLRSVHSGAGIDEYPDWQLNAILHAGFNCIEIFVRGVDQTSLGPRNIGDIIRRADDYGLGVVLYNYMRSYKHPDDPDAVEFFDSIYGNLARHYPTVKAISLVGESLEFPSKDPATTGKRWRESMTDGIPDPRPSPGWYPCRDYPAYLSRIRDAVHNVNPEIEVIFSTYNWGWNDFEVRKKFLENFPSGITLQVTYEIFKQNRRGPISCPVMDYTISAKDPGFYFTSEAETAAKLGIPVRVTSNLAGRTWDFGTAPYVPVPQRWLHRMKVLRKYLETCGVRSFYDNHHYGWTPNPANDLEKEMFTTGGTVSDFDAFLRQIAVRDYGKRAADRIVQAWSVWSDSMDHYVASNEDQYGPWRVGPAYPFVFQPNISRTMASKEILFPTAPYAQFPNNTIVKTLYMPYENVNQSPGIMRYPLEIEDLRKMKEMWSRGVELAEQALADMPAGRKHDNGERLLALGSFILHSISTTINIKDWWILNMKMQGESTRDAILPYLDRMEELAKKEMENVRATIPWVRIDSGIGWEPSMLYVCDEWHLQWKLRQMESMLREVQSYRAMVLL